jgi:hypothetical protein
MKNRNCWTASKFVFRSGRLVASKNSDEVSIGSRIIASLIAAFFKLT